MAQRLTATSTLPVPAAPPECRGAVFSIEHARRRRPHRSPVASTDHRGTVHSIEHARSRRLRPSASGGLIRVLVVGGFALGRAGLRRLLEDDPAIEVVGEAADGGEAGRLARADGPDVVLLDSGSLEFGPDLARTLGGRAAVLLLADCDGDERLLAAVRAGATGVLPRDSDPTQLAFAIRTVARGGALLPPRTTRRLISELVNTMPAPAR
jgi:CheY-like chemotaxis protein